MEMNFPVLILPITFGLAFFLGGITYSVVFAFFPLTAKQKGLSLTDVGLVVGIYEFSSMVVSIFFGSFLQRIGPRFLFLTGVLLCGCYVALFGLLDWGPDGRVYFYMCLLVRIFQGISTASFLVSGYAILGRIYADNFAKTIGTLETCGNLGMIVGPPIGGVLFDVGGFALPFGVLAGVIICFGFMAIYVLATYDTNGKTVSLESSQSNESGSVLSALKIPSIAIMGVFLLILFSMHGFFLLNISVMLHSRYDLSSSLIGLVFLLQATMVSAGSMFWSWLGDKMPACINPSLFIGLSLYSLSFALTAPVPFLNIAPVPLWLSIFLQIPYGIGVSTYVMTAKSIQIALQRAGYEESIHTYGIASGIFNTFSMLGYFAGPFIGGYILDNLGYQLTMSIGSAIALAFAGFLLIGMLLQLSVCSMCWRKPRDDDELVLGN